MGIRNNIKLVQSLEQQFSAAGIDNARRSAEELLAHVLGCKPLEIYLQPGGLSEEQMTLLEQLAVRVESGEPLQYVIGHVDFMGMKIKCDPRALIPRPETELLVEAVLNSDVWSQPSPALIDVGTGSGCIILALARRQPAASFTAVDASTAALDLAQENAQLHAPGDTISWKVGHLLDGVAPGSFNAVVANLPYIATRDWEKLSSAVRDHEPRSALDSGPSGMELIETLAAQARSVLKPGGMLFLEFGFDQGSAVDRCLNEAGYRHVRIKQDYAGLDRIASAVNPWARSLR